MLLFRNFIFVVDVLQINAFPLTVRRYDLREWSHLLSDYVNTVKHAPLSAAIKSNGTAFGTDLHYTHSTLGLKVRLAPSEMIIPIVILECEK